MSNRKICENANSQIKNYHLERWERRFDIEIVFESF